MRNPSVAKRVVYFIVSVGVSGCGVCLGVLLLFQPTAVGYACPYVWSGPWHSHPAVKLGKAGEPASQLRRGQLSTAIGWTFGVWAVLLWYMWVYCVDNVHVSLWTGYAYSISVTPRHLRPAVRSERMRNSSLGHNWMWCHSWGSCWWRRGLIICQAVSDIVLWWQCPPVGVYCVISSQFYPVRVGGV